MNEQRVVQLLTDYYLDIKGKHGYYIKWSVWLTWKGYIQEVIWLSYKSDDYIRHVLYRAEFAAESIRNSKLWKVLE